MRHDIRPIVRMPITIHGSARVGLGLWNSLAATLAVETFLFATGVVLYARTTSPRDRIGHWGFVAFTAFLFAIYLANLFGPPPPDTKAVAWSAIAMGCGDEQRGKHCRGQDLRLERHPVLLGGQNVVRWVGSSSGSVCRAGML